MTLRIKVVAGSSRNAVEGPMADGTLKVRVAAPPEKGRANQALLALLASHFGVPPPAVTIVAGYGSARKLVRVQGISESGAARRTPRLPPG
jgi:hypothetical protein